MNNNLPCAGNANFASPNQLLKSAQPEFGLMMPWGCFAMIARPAGLLTDKHMGARGVSGI